MSGGLSHTRVAGNKRAPMPRLVAIGVVAVACSLLFCAAPPLVAAKGCIKSLAQCETKLSDKGGTSCGTSDQRYGRLARERLHRTRAALRAPLARAAKRVALRVRARELFSLGKRRAVRCSPLSLARRRGPALWSCGCSCRAGVSAE